MFVTVAAALLTLPSLGGGLQLDDHMMANFIVHHLQGAGPEPRAWWNMFDLYGRTDPHEVSRLIQSNALAWWTPPTAKFAFLRPLSTAAHYLDYLLWPTQPWLMHLQNTLWYALVTFLAACLYFRMLPPLAAALAACMYAVDDAHIHGASWIASRNTMMTAVFVLLTVLAWDRARRTGLRRDVVLATACLVCAHACSEGGFMAWTYLFGYELALFEPAAALRSRVSPRASALLPLMAASVIWLACSSAAGFGVRGNEVYFDPRTTPLLFAQFALERLPRIMREQLLLPQLLSEQFPEALQPLFLGTSYTLLLVLALLAFALLRRSRSARMFGVGLLGSAILACSIEVAPRILFVIGIGAHGLMAELIYESVKKARRPGIGRAAFLAVAVLLGALHLPVALAAQPRAALIMPWLEERLRQVALNMLVVSGPRARMIVLNTPRLLETGLASAYLGATTQHQHVVYVLGASQQPVALHRPSENALILEPSAGYLEALRGKTLTEAGQAFHVGQVIETQLWRVTIELVTDEGRPARVRFDFPELDSTRTAWASWNPERDCFEEVKLPEVGGWLWLPGSTAMSQWRR